MAGDLNAAIDQAMAICWDEGYGYNLGGMAQSHAAGVDCSGLVGRVLHDNGFNYPSYHVGTINMGPALIAAGFTEYNYTSSFQMQSGDIVVMNHLDMSGGHTFFYVEDITAYTDPGADSANIGMVHRAKVEASSTRGHTAAGDHRKNVNGAYWEVWCHAFNELYDQGTYLPTEVYVCRDPSYTPVPPDQKLYITLKILDTQKKRKFENI